MQYIRLQVLLFYSFASTIFSLAALCKQMHAISFVTICRIQKLRTLNNVFTISVECNNILVCGKKNTSFFTGIYSVHGNAETRKIIHGLC
jgi:hypothetical protein